MVYSAGLKFYWSTDLSASMKTSIIIFVVLAVFFISMGIAFSKMDPKKDKVPTKGLKFIAVVLVDAINNLVEKNIPQAKKSIYAPYLLGFASFISLANIAAIFGLNPPFTNLGIALVLSIFPFFLFEFTGFKYQGLKGRIDGWLGPVKGISFLVLPISLIGEFTTPFSMGMRMFGNLFSGVVLGEIIIAVTEGFGYLIGGTISTLVFGVLMHPIFDLFFGLLQMYVYVMLTTMFIKQNM